MAPIKSVAVVGAGISGVSAAAHLLRHGFEVVVFERSNVAGGVWVFDPRRDKDPEYPVNDDKTHHDSSSSTNVNGASNNGANGVGGKKQQQQQTKADLLLEHAPPGPCYEGLMNNVPTTMMRSTLLNWPSGTPEHVTHKEIERYVQELAASTGAHDVTLYGTRVEEAVKVRPADGADSDGHGGASGHWYVRTKTMTSASPSVDEEDLPQYIEYQEREWSFDALVVASGHYHVPLIPMVPGLAAWKQRFPTRVMHSKSYRSPHEFRDQNVLLVGAGVSSLDIAKELEGVARRTYQSARGGKFDLDPGLLPANAERVGGLQEFRLVEHADNNDDDNDNDHADGTALKKAVPGTIHLTDGRVLTDIHQVILASGYQTTYPFLKGLESDTVPVAEADDTLVITADKCVTHNLHQDMFYIADPTLAFVGVPYYTSTFSMFDFQAEVVARVYAGLATLPSQEAMRAEHRARKAQAVREGSLGKAFHSLLFNQVEYMTRNLAWVNQHVEAKRIAPMRGVDEAWYLALEKFKTMSRRLVPKDSTQIQQPIASKYYQEAGLKTAVEV